MSFSSSSRFISAFNTKVSLLSSTSTMSLLKPGSSARSRKWSPRSIKSISGALTGKPLVLGRKLLIGTKGDMYESKFFLKSSNRSSIPLVHSVPVDSLLSSEDGDSTISFVFSSSLILLYHPRYTT